MPRPKRRIGTTGAGHFVVSEQNPNDPCGGQCACGLKPHDQRGPFAVFHGEIVQGGKRVRPVVCLPCVKGAIVDAENGGETSIVGAGGAADREFDGGEPTAPPDFQVAKARYEAEMAGRPMVEMPTLLEWLAERGLDKAVTGDATGGLSKTGIDPNAKSLLQARADASPVGMRGGAVHGRTDDPVAQLSDPANWGTPEAMLEDHNAGNAS